MSRGHIAIRIALADPDSGFLEPYARLKGPGADVEARPEIMRRRIEDAEKAWLEICGRAIADGAPGVELQISHFKQVPAFAVHRFDGVLVLTPNHNPSAGSCFPAIECEDTGQPFCAYRMFLDEFDTLMDDERESNRRSLSSARALRVTALNTDAFLHGLAITCGNNKESTRTIDALSRKPLTNTAKLRVLRAVEDALEQESLQKSIETSMSIAQFILEASGIDLREDALSVIDTGAEHAAKNGKLLAALRIMMNSITCDQNIDVQVAKSLMERY